MNSYLTTPIVPSHQVEEDLTSYLLDKITPFQVPEHQAWEAEAERVRVRVLNSLIGESDLLFQDKLNQQ